VGGPDVGAVGFAIGFSSTLLVLEELGLLQALTPRPADVYVAVTEHALDGEALRLVGELRAAGLAAVYDCEDKSLKAQMRAAGAAGHPLACVLGPDELASQSVQLKDMRTGAQRSVPRAAVAAEALSALGPQAAP
jgi:histidyl-tRNA synthetase